MWGIHQFYWYSCSVRDMLKVCIVFSGYPFSLLYSLVIHSQYCNLWLSILIIVFSGYPFSLLYFLVIHSHYCILWLSILTIVFSGYPFSLLYSLVIHSHYCILWLSILAIVFSGWGACRTRQRQDWGDHWCHSWKKLVLCWRPSSGMYRLWLSVNWRKLSSDLLYTIDSEKLS